MIRTFKDNSHGLEDAHVTINHDGTISVQWLDGFKMQLKADSIMSCVELDSEKLCAGLYKVKAKGVEYKK